MNYSKKYRWALAGFIILLILNIGTLATIWFSPGPPYFGMRSIGVSAIGSERGNVAFRARSFMAEELDLSADQEQQFETLRQEHLEKIRPLLKEVSQQRREYFNSLEQGDTLLTSEAMDSIAQQIGETHAKIEKANYQHFTMVKEILNEDQQEQFKRFLEIMVRRTIISVPTMPPEPSFHLKGETETTWSPR